MDIRRPIGPPQLAPLKKPLSFEALKRGEEWPDNVGLWTQEALDALQRYLRDTYHMQTKAADNMTIVSQTIIGGGTPGGGVSSSAETQADVMSKVSLGF